MGAADGEKRAVDDGDDRRAPANYSDADSGASRIEQWASSGKNYYKRPSTKLWFSSDRAFSRELAKPA